MGWIPFVFERCSRLVRLPSTPRPPISALQSLLASFAVSRLRCRQSSTSSSKSAAAFLITASAYLAPLTGQQIFCPIQQLERCRLFNRYLEGTPTTRIRFPLFPAHQHLRFRSVPKSPDTLSKGRGSRTLAGGYGTSSALWSIPTTPTASGRSRSFPSTGPTNSVMGKGGMWYPLLFFLPPADSWLLQESY